MHSTATSVGWFSCSRIHFRVTRSFISLVMLLIASAFTIADPTNQPVNAEPTVKTRIKPVANLTPAPSYFTDNDCRTCHHVQNRSLSHPVDVFPSFQTPQHLPLESGQIVCTTCHDNDMNAHGAARAEPGNSGLLRGGLPGTAFCASCHQQSPNQSANLQHASFLRKAHLHWDSDDDNDLRINSFHPGLDPESQDCMSCHDGASAKNIGPSHPVGVSYQSSSLRQTRHRLAPVERLDSRIRLFDGNLGCGSCHSPYAANEKLLAIPNDRDQLCVSCHQ